MNDYPESKRLAEASKVTQPVGEFLDWLQGQGVHLMTWREDLSDLRPTDERCFLREGSDREGNRIPCRPAQDAGNQLVPGTSWWNTHCLHWHNPDRKDGAGQEKPGTCCWCGKSQYHEVTGLKGWIDDPRSFEQLLADWAGIDLKKVEAERRQMLASLHKASTPKED